MTEQCNKDPRLCWSVRCQLGKKCIGGQATAVQPVAIVVPHEATVRLEWASVKAAHNAKPGPLYARAAVEAAQPEAVGWKRVPVEPTEAMLKAGVDAFQHAYSEADILSDWRACFKAMLASAPTPEPMRAPTAEPVAWQARCRFPDDGDTEWSGWADVRLGDLPVHQRRVQERPGNYELRALGVIGATPPSAATPEPSDAERLDWLREECCDLRCISSPTGGDDYDIRWVVIQHHMAKPHEREIGESYTDEPRDAIDAAIRATKGGKL